MNSVIRGIALTTFILAPMAVGQLFTFIGYVATGICVACWNVVSVGFEYLLLEMIYRYVDPEMKSWSGEEMTVTWKNAFSRSVPALQEKKSQEPERSNQLPEAENLVGSGNEADGEVIKSKSGPMKLLEWMKKAFGGWKIYFTHPIRFEYDTNNIALWLL